MAYRNQEKGDSDMNTRLSVALAGVIIGLAGVSAHAYDAVATVASTFGGNSADPFGSNANTLHSTQADLVWTSGIGPPSPFANELASVSNNNYFSTMAGYNTLNYYNSDFASAGLCAALTPPLATLTGTRKYGCRYTDEFGDPLAFLATPTTGSGPVAVASGVLTVTDTTLTGTLTMAATTDLPIGGTATSIGDGTDAYNLRTADNSPFGNA
jgi:hypothetical protein